MANKKIQKEETQEQVEQPPEKKPRKRRRRINRGGSGKYYFTQEHEDAIVKYCSENVTRAEREHLATKYIVPVFNEMVDKIVFTYKFNTLPNCDELRDECKVWLITVLDKFDPAKGSKAFSYFSVITKNWFIHKVKKHSYRQKKEIHYDTMPKYIEERYMSTENQYLPEREKEEFWNFFWKEIEGWGKLPMKPNEKKVYDAMKVLMENAEDIEIFNKKAIYLYIRELTGLNTKQVVNNLNKLRVKYRDFKKDWNEGNL